METSIAHNQPAKLPPAPVEDAASWYFNLDRLIQHVNADGRVKIFYSTPGRYVDAKRAETEVRWPLKAGPWGGVGGFWGEGCVLECDLDFVCIRDWLAVNVDARWRMSINVAAGR